MDYLPKLVTTEQACAWLASKTGGTWVLPRLLESGLTPWFWVDYDPKIDARMFGGKLEGYLAPMASADDIRRLEFDGTDALVNWTRSHDGALVQVLPAGIMRVPLAELKFKREDIESLWVALGGATAEPAEEAADETKSRHRWTPQFIEEVRAYRSTHTAKETASRYGVSDTLIRRKLADPAESGKPITIDGVWRNKS